jgi:phytanoyl-CoA hydroxylase
MLKPHHLNKGYTWTPAPRKGGMIDDTQAAFWNENGYLLLKGLFDPQEVIAVRDEIDVYADRKLAELRAAGPQQYDINEADKITFTSNIVLGSKIARDFTLHEGLARVSLDLLSDDVRLYWDQAVYKMPEPKRDFPWHQDTGYAFTTPQNYLTCWIPLVKATVDNGCPWVMPKLHKQGTYEHWWTPEGWRCLEEAPEALPIEVEIGDVVCFSSLTPHRTGPNISDSVRKAYILQFMSDPTLLTPYGQTDTILQDNPDRQFFTAKAGKPVGVSETAVAL